MWSWETEAVLEGESVGLCMKPTTQPDAFASCWMFKQDMNGAYGQP